MANMNAKSFLLILLVSICVTSSLAEDSDDVDYNDSANMTMVWAPKKITGPTFHSDMETIKHSHVFFYQVWDWVVGFGLLTQNLDVVVTRNVSVETDENTRASLFYTTIDELVVVVAAKNTVVGANMITNRGWRMHDTKCNALAPHLTEDAFYCIGVNHILLMSLLDGEAIASYHYSSAKVDFSDYTISAATTNSAGDIFVVVANEAADTLYALSFAGDLTSLNFVVAVSAPTTNDGFFSLRANPHANGTGFVISFELTMNQTSSIVFSQSGEIVNSFGVPTAGQGAGNYDSVNNVFYSWGVASFSVSSNPLTAPLTGGSILLTPIKTVIPKNAVGLPSGDIIEMSEIHFAPDVLGDDDADMKKSDKTMKESTLLFAKMNSQGQFMESGKNILWLQSLPTEAKAISFASQDVSSEFQVREDVHHLISHAEPVLLWNGYFEQVDNFESTPLPQVPAGEETITVDAGAEHVVHQLSPDLFKMENFSNCPLSLEKAPKWVSLEGESLHFRDIPQDAANTTITFDFDILCYDFWYASSSISVEIAQNSQKKSENTDFLARDQGY